MSDEQCKHGSHAPCDLCAAEDEEHDREMAIDARIEAAVAAERERCARLCEDIGDGYQTREAYKWAELKTDAQTGAHDCAAAIRQAPAE